MTGRADGDTGKAEPYVMFELADCTYGVRSRELRHMEMVGTITPVPNAAPFVAGVTFSRGHVIPVIDLRRRFGLPAAATTLKSRLLVVDPGGRVVGLMVDQAKRFEPIEAGNVQPPPAAATEAGGSFVKGVATLGGRLVLLIDIERIVAPVQAAASGGELPGSAPAESSGRSGERHGTA